MPGVSCFHFDSIGVPAPEVMAEEFGGPESWQRDATARCITLLAALDDGTRIAVLDGQTRPSFVEEAVRRAPMGSAAIRHQIVLLDCDPEVRAQRLAGPRQQPELSSSRMDNWAAYLRGDRGIFTRRAVALLDGGEVRAITQHYEADRGFRENVNHYIHDFEAMLRSLLSTRDGNALGVTLLSSDMGKLYVALAQAIERLRA